MQAARRFCRLSGSGAFLCFWNLLCCLSGVFSAGGVVFCLGTQSPGLSLARFHGLVPPPSLAHLFLCFFFSFLHSSISPFLHSSIPPFLFHTVQNSRPSRPFIHFCYPSPPLLSATITYRVARPLSGSFSPASPLADLHCPFSLCLAALPLPRRASPAFPRLVVVQQQLV
ncbi:hypothetical protein B0J13DRAFT_274761 [Dactylonectria estremocensis]|uniref:Transmembrane protein n=1 Tax=Dactylonectria estremocensis TaxID=1079267 RepID=A0A9P9F1D0_9HYPO|nr:hypothetical protein B0J13DRAFT_274761 [Dactylonectria estremocensis]